MTEGPPPAWLKIVASLCGMIKGGNANVQFIPILWVQWHIDIPFLSHSQIKIARSHPGSSSIWFLIIWNYMGRSFSNSNCILVRSKLVEGWICPRIANNSIRWIMIIIMLFNEVR